MCIGSVGAVRGASPARVIQVYLYRRILERIRPIGVYIVVDDARISTGRKIEPDTRNQITGRASFQCGRVRPYGLCTADVVRLRIDVPGIIHPSNSRLCI